MDSSPFSEEELGQPPPYYDSDSPAQPSPGDSWFASMMAPCVRSDCPCDSFNGEPGEYCCFTCRDGLRCIRPYHRIRRSPCISVALVISAPVIHTMVHLAPIAASPADVGTRCTHPYHRRLQRRAVPSVLDIVPDPRSISVSTSQ